jgi:hypothetical protein
MSAATKALLTWRRLGHHREVALKQDIKLLPSQGVKRVGHHKVIQFRIPVTSSL